MSAVLAPDVVLTRTLRAPRALLWQAWTDPRRDGRTRLTLRARFDSAAEKARIIHEFGAYQGAHQTLDRLSRHLAGRAGRTADVE